MLLRILLSTLKKIKSAQVVVNIPHQKKAFRYFLLISYLFISGCASSDVSRNMESNIDMGVQNAKNLVGNAGDSSITDSYQNASQRTKGALLGGTAGAITGAFYSAIGVLPGATVGAILGASYGSYIDTFTTLQDRLENRGATIVVLGDQILIVLPSARIFNDYSSDIKSQAYTTLALVSQFINQYTKMLVKISVYTGVSSSSDVDFALSQEEAKNVAKFLLASGVDARVLYAEGCGGSHPVMNVSSGWDSDNYRIEITLEKLYV